MGISSVIKKYWENSKRIRQSYDNPLKKTDKLSTKDELDREFYDEEAQKYLDDFQKSLFLYDPNEKMPISHQFFYSHLTNLTNKRVLDICCGYGFTSVKLAKNGANITSVDISPKMIELTRRNAEYNNVEVKINADVMSVQAMTLKDNTFDYVVGLGALHHLNLETTGKEVSRVLKPGGEAIFLEPRIPFKFLIFVRSFFPNKCFESPGGSQLSDREVREFSQYFSETKIDYFLFLRKLVRFPIIKNYTDQLDRLDLDIIKRLPPLRKLYWAFVLRFTK